MKVSKRLIYLVLSIAIIMSSIPFIGYAATPNDFPDLPSDWSRDALLKAVNNGLITGSNGKLMPLSNLTRAQMAAIVNKAFGATRMASLVEFTDVKTSDWYFRDLAIAYQMGTFSGSNGKMNPNKPISREEVFVVLAKAFQLPAGNERSIMRFRDSADVSAWAVPYVAAMIEAGYVSGSNGLLNPRTEIKRNEFAALMDNVVKHYITEPGVYTGTFNGNIIVRVPGVTFKDAVINGRLVVGDGVGTGQIVLENVEVKGPTLVRGQAQLVEAPGTPEVPAGPAVPPVVAPPVTPGNPGGGDTPPPTTEPTTEAPIAEKTYGFRVTYKTTPYLAEIKYPITKKFTFDVIEAIRVEVQDEILAEINNLSRTSFIEDLLSRINPNTSKSYAAGIANRVLDNEEDLLVFGHEDYIKSGTGLFVRAKNELDSTGTVSVGLIREIAAAIILEDTLDMIADLETLYPDEIVTNHIDLYFFVGNSLVKQSKIKVIDLMTKFNEIYAVKTIDSLVDEVVLKIEYNGKAIEFEIVEFK